MSPSDDRSGAEQPRAPGPGGLWARRSIIVRRALVLTLLSLGSAIAGWVCARLNVPLPWMVGPLLLTAVYAVAGGRPYAPVALRYGGQIVVSSAVALNLTAENLASVASQVGLMLMSAALLIVLSGFLAAMVLRTGGVDRATALFASLPGGPLEMATLAEHYGGKGGLVAFSQTLRIAAIVTLIPPLLILFGGEFRDITARATELRPAGLAMVLAIGLATSLAFKRIGGANAFFLGPLFGVGAATVFGAPVAPIPGEAIAVAQIALGMTLGRMFDRTLIATAGRFMVQAGGISLILIGFSAGLGLLFALIGPGSFHVYVLANAPGSITEMAVAAKGLDLDPALVTAFHMVRIFGIIPFAALIYRAFVRLADRIERRKGG